MFFSTGKVAGEEGQGKKGEEDGFQKTARRHSGIVLMRYSEERR